MQYDIPIINVWAVHLSVFPIISPFSSIENNYLQNWDWKNYVCRTSHSIFVFTFAFDYAIYLDKKFYIVILLIVNKSFLWDQLIWKSDGFKLFLLWLCLENGKKWNGSHSWKKHWSVTLKQKNKSFSIRRKMHVKKAQLIKWYLRNANKNSPKQLFIYLSFVVLIGNVLFNLFEQRQKDGKITLLPFRIAWVEVEKYSAKRNGNQTPQAV